MINNQRQTKRFSFDKPVQYRPRESASSNGALAHDLSLGGLQMTINNFIALGSILELSLDFPEVSRQVVIKGKVVWIRENIYSERFDIGIKFIPDEQSAELISAYIKKKQV